MEQSNRMPRFLVWVIVLIIAAAGYDFCRPFIAKEKPWPWQAPAPVIAVEAPKPQLKPATRKVNYEALPKALAKGKWGVIIYWPAPQFQDSYSDEVISSIKSDGGVLHSLTTCAKYYDVIGGVNEEDIVAPILPGKGKGVAEGGGAICVWDLKNEGKPRLVYNQSFPYYGTSGEYVSEGWSSGEVLASEITATLNRWNEQGSHTNH